MKHRYISFVKLKSLLIDQCRDIFDFQIYEWIAFREICMFLAVFWSTSSYLLSYSLNEKHL